MKFTMTDLAATAISSMASADVLYDASSNVTPDNAEWGWGFESLPSGGLESGPSGLDYVTLDTTSSMSIHAGWEKTSPISLNRAIGYIASWTLQVNSESHNSSNQRAGLSTIILGNDDYGVEIGYWQNEVFVYNTNFTPGESATLNTTASLLNYQLSVSGNTYSLSVDGTPTLSGSLRNYSAEGLIYSIPNALFYGDDTTQADSKSNWQSFSVQAVPEPAPALALLAGGVLLMRRRTSQ